MRFERLEQAINTLNDMDGGWWPFLWLRPKKEEPVTLGRLALMSIAYGVFYGGIFGVASAAVGQTPWGRVPATALLFVPLFFCAWGLLFRPFWNARARRLSGGLTSKS